MGEIDKTVLELYKFYFAELKDLNEGYFAFEITMSATILTAIGWFLTSEKAQKMVTENKLAVRMFVFAIALTAAAEFYIVRRIYVTSHHIHKLVEHFAADLKPALGQEYFHYRLTTTPT